MIDHESLDWPVWRRWVLANAWSELIGLGGSAAIVLALMQMVGPASSVSAVLLTALAAVVTAAILEGGIVGLAQWTVLRRRLEMITAHTWTGATILGAFVAWLLGMIPSTIAGLQETTVSSAPAELTFAQTMGLAFLMGMILGPILAFFQWRVLRHHLRRSGWWIPANALAWAFGMMIIFAGAGSLTPEASPIEIGGAVMVTCLVAGAVVGAIHGLVLIWLLKDITHRHQDIEAKRPPA